ncbi:MAG TPA: AAA family ATPase [Chloroflexia bacterium]|nr:AAA family ATPase [Chloroflexia bacterium]
MLPGEQAVYLPPFYYAEQGIARNLIRLVNCPPNRDKLAEFRKTDYPKMFVYLEGKEGFKLADKQQEGIVMALAKPVGVLTGGPGTGKTTSMLALIRILSLKKKTIVLAAPTGRAAKRLSETTGLEAKTLHRLLATRPGGKPQYDQDNPLQADIVIVDEVSMLDTLLMNNLLKAIASGTHLLLVGDADQLPSVGAGNVLADVIRSGVVPVVKLDQIFRQGADSAIISNAHLINEGKMPVTGGEIKDFFFFNEDDPELAGDLVVDLVAKRIPARFSFNPADIQVLSPMHRGKAGVGYLNEKLQEVLNPAGDGKGQKQFGGTAYRVGDKVLQLRNNYDKEVFNGDGGVITGISHENQEIKVRLEDGREVSYDFGELDELTLAYAMSIHKSQGSEYPVTVIPVVMGHFMLLERKLIYTAITRAKKLVVLVGSKKALAIAVKNGPDTSGFLPTRQGQGSGSSSGGVSSRHRSGRYTGLAFRLLQQG